ncbi:MAG: hypothetical protein ACRD0B_07640 [Acidimicrobiales bacterium]
MAPRLRRTDERAEEIAIALEHLAEELSELAMDVLRDSLDSAEGDSAEGDTVGGDAREGGPGQSFADEAEAARRDERRLNRARGAVLKAAGLLRERAD